MPHSRTIKRSRFPTWGALLLLGVLTDSGAAAADRFFGYNHTTATDFTDVFLAPAGTDRWGPNQALNDKDHTWESGERLSMTDMSRGQFDLKVVDRAGVECIIRGIDLTRDTTFDLRDGDLANCNR